MALGAAIGHPAAPEWKNRKIRFHGDLFVKCKIAGRPAKTAEMGPFCGLARPESQSWGQMHAQPQFGLKIRFEPLSGPYLASFGLKRRLS